MQIPVGKLHQLHPVFRLLSMNGVRNIVKSYCQIIFFRRYQNVYKKGSTASLIFIPLYGSFRIMSEDVGTLCENIGVGQTLGEECLYEKAFSERQESCIVESNSAALVIDKGVWIMTRSKITAQIASKGIGNLGKLVEFLEDMNQLDEIFRRNYNYKKELRENAAKLKISIALKPKPHHIKRVRGSSIDSAAQQ